MKRALVAFATVSMLSLAGCGGKPGGLPAESTTTTVAPVAASTTTTTAQSLNGMEIDNAYVQKSLLQVSDFPGSKDEGEYDTYFDHTAINACIEAPADAVTWTSARGHLLNLDGKVKLVSAASSVTNKTFVDADFAGINDPKNAQCLTDEYNKSVEQLLGNTVDSFTSKLTRNNTGDPDQIALRLTTTAVRFGQPSVSYNDILAQRDGRYVLSVQISSTDQPVSPEVLKQVLAAMRSHIKAAQATVPVSTTTTAVAQASSGDGAVPTPR